MEEDSASKQKQDTVIMALENIVTTGEMKLPIPHLQLVPVPTLTEVKLVLESGAVVPTPLPSRTEREELIGENIRSDADAADIEKSSEDGDLKRSTAYPAIDNDPVDHPTHSSSNMPNSTFVKNGVASLSSNTNCSNCASADVNSQKLSGFINCSVFDFKNKSMEKKDIKILEMLTTLYTLRSANQGQVGKLLAAELLMCETCVRTLSQLYQLYHEYLSLSITSGAIMSKLIGLRPSEKLDSRKWADRRSKNVSTFREAGQSDIFKRKTGSTGVTISRTRTVRSPRQPDQTQTVIKRQKRDTVDIKPDVKNPSVEREAQRITVKSTTKPNLLLGGKPTVMLQSRKRNKAMILRSESNPQTYDGEPVEQLEESSAGDTCRRCGKAFKSFVGLKVHYAAHLRDDNKFECKECGKKFRKKDALDTHAKIDHEGFKPHECPYEGCDRNFRLKDKLKLHVQVVHEKRKPFPCPKCEKSFRTKYHLKVHDVAQHIQGDNSIGCSQCKRKFASREALTTHIKTHQEDKPFICSICQKGFHSTSRLKLHAKSHDVIPSCICSVCGKLYKHVRDLRLHETVHQDESTYRFSCGDCPKKFYRIDLLRVHQSNEQHFSTETVGPSMSKLDATKSVKKSKAKRRKRKNLEIKEETEMFDELESPDADSLVACRKSGIKINKGATRGSSKSKKKTFDPSISNEKLRNTTDLPHQPNITTNDGDAARHIVENKVTEEVSNSVNQINSSSALTNSFQLPLTSHLSRTTLYPLKDSNDPSLPSFCISAGAEQIGFDVISAYINNLN